jgi:hypothetical protein
VILPIGIPLPKAAIVKAADKPALTAKQALSAKAAKAAQKQKTLPRTPDTRPAASAPSAGADVSSTPTLRSLPFDGEQLSAGWNEAPDAMRRAGNQALDLLDAWLGGANVDAIASIVEAEDIAAPIRKAARRAVHVLKSRGIAIPQRPHVARLPDSRTEVAVEATMLVPDGSGAMSFSITSRDVSGRYRVAEVIVREPLGIIQAGGGWVSGSQLRESRARAVEGLGFAPVPVPVDWARHRVAAARKMNAVSGQILPLRLDGCRELLDPPPEAEPAHPVGDLEKDITSEVAWARAPGSAKFHEEPEFRSWMPERRALDEVLQRLGQRLGPEGVQDPQRANAGLEEEIRLATDRFFSPEVRVVVAARMRDVAISIRTRKGDEQASLLLAVARAVREAGLITSPPQEIPFLVAFFQKGISYLWQQGGGSLRIPIAAPPPTSEGEAPAPEVEAT